MAFPADAIDVVDLKALVAGGLVNEDVLQRIYKLSTLETPFLDLIGRDTCENSYTEWTRDSLGSPDATNAVVSGADLSTYGTATGSRQGNHTQISRRGIAVSERTRKTSNIGRGDEFVYQSMITSERLKQDVESIATGRQASRADDNNTTAGLSAGFSAWLTTNDSLGTDGAATGFNTSTKVVAAVTVGDQRVFTEALLKAQILNAYTQYGNVTTLMSTPTFIQNLNQWLVGSSATIRVAPTANVQGSGGKVDQTAQGYYSMIVTDFGTVMTIVPNRMQQDYDSDDSTPDTDSVDVFGIDPSSAAFATLDGFKVTPIAKLGLSDRAQATVDWTLKVFAEQHNFVIRDIDADGTITA